jgi:hypothetical protein
LAGSRNAEQSQSHGGDDQPAIHGASIERSGGKGMTTSSWHDQIMTFTAFFLPGSFWRPILVGACGGSAAALLGWLACRGSRPTAGWGHVRAGAMHWTGLVLSAGLSALMGYVVRFVGSSRADGATQMQILGWLALAFAAGAIFSLVRMHSITRADIRWRGGTVRFRASGRGRAERPIPEIMSLSESGSGWFVATFGDGISLRIDPYAKGADALLQRISDQAGKGRPSPD